MNRLTPPKKQPIPFAINGLREPIITTTPPGDNSTSYNDGFPETTMTIGGLPPKGKGMNQILHELSDLSKWSSAGALNSFDPAFSTSIGGYPNGAILLGDDGMTIFISRVDNNSSNPNTGGAGWDNLKTYIIDGTVKTVNSNTPDVSGNVVLSAQDVGALPITGGTVTGSLTASSGVYDTPNVRVYSPNNPQALPHDLTIEGNIYSNAGIYEQGERVYSPNNPPPQQYIGVADVQIVGRTAFVVNSGVYRFPSGNVLTALGDFGAPDGYGEYSAIQKLINGTWYTIGGN